MIEGTINDFPFKTPLEPDGKGSHWFRINEALCKTIGIKAGDVVTLVFKPINEWPEPEEPSGLKDVLIASPKAYKAWLDITVMARWDWIRWISSTKNPQTRHRRIESARDMLETGKRRPCCFNRNLCTETYVSKNGVLLTTTHLQEAEHIQM